MKHRLKAIVLSIGIACALAPSMGWASLEEGYKAYQAKNYTAAFKAFLPLAKKGDPAAQFNLAKLYRMGQGVAQDDKEAVKWYRRAAEQDFEWAQGSLGVMYERGRGVPQDYQEAVKWYRRAADNDLATAQAGLGLMYELGRGVPQDYQEAIKWYRRAADQGNATSQSFLGSMYSSGKGCAPNRVVAYALFNISDAKAREGLAMTMTPNEIETGQALTREIVKQGNLLNAIDSYLAKR